MILPVQKFVLFGIFEFSFLLAFVLSYNKAINLQNDNQHIGVLSSTNVVNSKTVKAVSLA
jgi:hypothetical protein